MNKGIAVRPAARIAGLLLVLQAVPATPTGALMDAAIPGPPRTERHGYDVRVIPAIETVAALARAAGFEEYGSRGIAAYDSAVNAWLEPHRDHAAIEVVRRLRRDMGLSWGMPLELALLVDSLTWEPRAPIEPLPGFLDPRWTAAAARDFLDAVRQFDRDAGASKFFAAHGALYREVEDQLGAGLQPLIDIEWFRRQFGRADAVFTVVPGLLNGPNSYGLHMVLPDGRLEIYAIIGTPAFESGSPVQYPLHQVSGLVVHELAHSFINPWVDAHAARLLPAATSLFDAVEDRMRANAYGEPRIVLYESLVRAATLRYFLDRGDSTAARRALHDDRGKGFLWTAELAEVLINSGTLDSAREAVFAFFDEWGADPVAMIGARSATLEAEAEARRRTGPQVVRTVPAYGAAGVDAGLDALIVEFDREMSAGVAILGSIELTGRPRWDDDRRVLTLPVRLRPGATYVLELNSEEHVGFRSAAGEPLAPRTWRFTVSSAEPEGS
jgi:hypothetical protein